MVGKSYIATELVALATETVGSTDLDTVQGPLEGLHYASVAGPWCVLACDHQVQIGQATRRIVPADGTFYDFPFSGPAFIAPIDVIAVPPKKTGNPRCTTEVNG